MCATAPSSSARKTIRQHAWSRCRRIAAGRRPARRLSRSVIAAAPCAARLRPVAAARREGRRAGPYGRARHAGMAAGQGGGADRGVLSRNRRRRAAGDLSLHRQQSRRGGAGQAPHRGGDHRPSAAAARRARTGRRRARARTAGRRICAGRRPRPPPPRAACAPDRRDRAAQRAWRAKPVSAHRCQPDEALRRIDAWLCDLKDLAIKDGLHIYGRAPEDADDPAWQRSAAAERAALLAALDGRRVAPGPAGSPSARPARRAADRPQSLHRRSAHAADADRDGPRPARRRRGGARASADAMATCRARSSSICGAAPRCAPAARRSRRGLR